MIQLPADAAYVIQIIPLTRGSVVIAGEAAYACTNTADIVSTVAVLLPNDGSLPFAAPDAFLKAMGQEQRIPHPPGTMSATVPHDNGSASEASPTPEPVAAEGRNPLFQRENLLKLCDAWAQERITDEQFDEYLAATCPDIALEEAYMTRDSFGPKGTESSQIGELLEPPGDPR